jgi:hypothetical protein
VSLSQTGRQKARIDRITGSAENEDVDLNGDARLDRLRFFRMRTFICLLTTFVFAFHASLGCGAHRACGNSTVMFGNAEVGHNHVRDITGHHHDHNGTADHEDNQPCEPCSNSDCSYVKAETQQVDAAGHLTLGTALLTFSPIETSEPPSRYSEPLCKADLSSTQLYVWHCALII